MQEVIETDASDDKHKKFCSWVKRARRLWSDWREEADEAYQFYAGNQWSEADTRKMKEEGRHPITFNRETRTINAVAGLEVQNRQSVVYHPRELQDGGVSDLVTQAAKWARDNCDAEDEESEAFIDSLICGVGWVSTRMDYEVEPEGRIVIERIDPREMGVGPSKKRNFDDAKYRFRIKKYERDEFEERFPGKDWNGSGTFGYAEETSEHENLREKYTRELEDNTIEKEIEVAQLQYFEIEYAHFVQDQMGKITEVPAGAIDRVRAVAPTQGWKVSNEKRPKRVYKEVFMTPHEVLEESDLTCGAFTFQAITGLRDADNNTWFGLHRLMKDPQMWANKWLTQILHILNTQAKSGKLLFESGAFKNPKKALQEWAKPNTAIEMNNGAITSQRYAQLQATGFPPGMDMILQYAVGAINDTPGVNMELMGLANRQQAGVLEESRKQAGVTVLAIFFDSLRRYRKEQGRVLYAYIRDYISDGRLIRINEGLGSKYIPLLRDQLSEQYDLIVDDAPSAPNQQEKTYQALAQLLPQLLQAGVPVPPDVIDYAPLPTELKVKWRQFIESSKQNPAADEARKLEMQKVQAETNASMAKAKLDEAKAAKEISTIGQDLGQAEQAKATQESIMRMNELGLQAKMKMEEIDANERIKREELERKLAFEREKVAAELSAKIHLETQKMEMDAALKNKEIDTRVNERAESETKDREKNFDIEGAITRAIQPLEQKLQTKQVSVTRTQNGLTGQITVS